MSDPPTTDTAELLTRLQASAPGAGMQLYDRFADRLYDLSLFLTRDSAMAAETTRDVIVMTAQQDEATLADVDTLRAWLYAQARNETFALLGVRGRTPPEDRVVEVPELPAGRTSADLGALVWAATAAFSERDQALLTLHLRHGLADDSLAQAMGLSTGAVEVLLPATTERVRAQLTALLVLATDGLPPDAPEELQQLHRDWDGRFTPLVRGRVVDMLAECRSSTIADLPSPLVLLQQVPLVPAPASLRDAVEERLVLVAQMNAGAAAGDPEIDDTLPPGVVPATSSAEDGLTIPPGEGPPVVPSDPVPTGPATGDEPVLSERLIEDRRQSADAASAPAAVTGSGPSTAGEGTSDLGRPPRGYRTPLPLAIALGLAVGLVVAAALLRVVSGSPLLGEDDVATTAETGSAATAPAEDDPPAQTPGRLSAPADMVMLESEGETAVRLTNTGGQALDWQVLSLPGWVSVDRVEGQVDPGATVELALTYAHPLAEGNYAGEITFGWNGDDPGGVSVQLAGAVDRPPELHNLQVGSRSLIMRGCGLDQTEVAVVVADEHPVAEVVITTGGPGPETQSQYRLTADTGQPGRFLGVVGPFDRAGAVTLELEATDVRGNRTVLAGGELQIGPC